MSNYKILNNQQYSLGRFSIVPIRMEDRYNIMEWRNEQIHYLRQSELLTKEEQDSYFDTVVAKLFEKEKPEQILFSYLEDEKCIGYGGLVHIDWKNKNAEISFLLRTALNNKFFFIESFNDFLALIKNVAQDVGLHKIFTYGYDIQEYRFLPMIQQNYSLEAHLKEHVIIDEDYIDIKIYSKIL